MFLAEGHWTGKDPKEGFTVNANLLMCGSSAEDEIEKLEQTKRLCLINGVHELKKSSKQTQIYEYQHKIEIFKTGLSLYTKPENIMNDIQRAKKIRSNDRVSLN